MVANFMISDATRNNIQLMVYVSISIIIIYLYIYILFKGSLGEKLPSYGDLKMQRVQ